MLDSIKENILKELKTKLHIDESAHKIIHQSSLLFIQHWVQTLPYSTNMVDKNGWNILHHLAQTEAHQYLTPQTLTTLLSYAIKHITDIHATDKNGYTAFNIAAPASITGRILTNHWFELAIKDQGSKGLNSPSGSHNSTLAQYIAKWSNADEIGPQLDKGMAKGMQIATPNASGWTPLHAACAMTGRTHAVIALANRYTRTQLLLSTTEQYQTTYPQSPEIITFGIALSAGQIATERAKQAHELPSLLKKELLEYNTFLTSKTKFTRSSTKPPEIITQSPHIAPQSLWL